MRDPTPGVGRLLAGSIELPELASSLALCLPACWLDGRLEALDTPPGAVLRLPADTTVLFFLRDQRANLSSLRRARESCSVVIALISLSIMLRQGPSEESSRYPV